jgi:hypothetical protein
MGCLTLLPADAAKVRAWLSDIKLSQFSDAFVDNGFDSLGMPPLPLVVTLALM